MATTNDCTTVAPLTISTLLDHLCAAVDAAREQAADSPAWLRAIDKAWNWLLTQEVIVFDTATHSLRVESEGTPGTFYTANGVCGCKGYTDSASGVCYHRAAARIVRRALEARARDAAARDEQAEIEALAAELYQEASDAGDAWYTMDLARAGARSRMGGLSAFARDWERDQAAMRRAALAPRSGIAHAA